MKIILFILALTISQITSAENGGAYTQMNLDEVQSDPEIQDLLNFGVQYLTQEEILVQKLPDAQYTVSQIHSVWSQAVSGINYRFDVDIINNLAWVLRATFEVYSQPWTNTKEVTSYVYDVTANPNSSVNEEEFVLPNNEGDLDGAYEAVDPSEVNTNEDLQHSLDAGTQEVVNQAIIDHLLPESVYQIAQIHSIYSQAVSGTNYRFDVDLINCAGLVVRAVFTVYSQSWTHTLDTTPGTLHITSIPNEGLVGGDCPTENNGSEEENTWGCEEENNWEDDDDGSIGGGWTLMDPQDAENDQEVQDALNFGVPELVKRAIASGELPDGSYSLDAVASVEEQVVSGMNYRFDVSLSSTDGLGVRVSFEVYSQSWTGTQELTSYFIFAVGSAEEDSF